MATSIHKGYIRHPSVAADQNYPVNVSMVRDGIINNALHIADQFGQVRVNWVSETGEYISRESDATAEYVRVVTVGPFPACIRSDGSSYRYRMRVRGYLSTAGTATVTAAVHTTPATISSPTSAAYSARVSVTGFSSTSDGWLTTTPDTDYLRAEWVNGSMQTYSVQGVAGGGEYEGVSVLPLYASVYVGETSGASVYFNLTGFYVAEYIGTT